MHQEEVAFSEEGKGARPCGGGGGRGNAGRGGRAVLVGRARVLLLLGVAVVVGLVVTLAPEPVGRDLLQRSSSSSDKGDQGADVRSAPTFDVFTTDDEEINEYRRSMVLIMERSNSKASSATYAASIADDPGRRLERQASVLSNFSADCSDVGQVLLPHSWYSVEYALEIPERYGSSGMAMIEPRMMVDDVMMMPAGGGVAEGGIMPPPPSAAPMMAADGASSSLAPSSGSEKEAGVDYSETNNQVDGVDEADIVKQDGNFIYSVGGNELVVVRAFPKADRRVLSRLTLNADKERSFLALDMLLNGDTLLVFAASQTIQTTSTGATVRKPRVIMQKLDCKDRENCQIFWEGSAEGNFVTARLTSDIALLAVQNKVSRIQGKSEVSQMTSAELLDAVVPKFSDGSVVTDEPSATCDSILYMKSMKPKTLISLFSVKMKSDGRDSHIIDSITFAAPSSWRKPTVMVSLTKIYLGFYNEDSRYSRTRGDEFENTIVFGYSFQPGAGVFAFDGSVEVPGELLNQFSMDEYRGYLRIATTMDIWGQARQEALTENMVFVVDLTTYEFVGNIFGIAKNERIYSVRFVGPKAYMVTFRQIDPLFVLDLEDPHKPRILGELKIPGYSDYLHPVNATHLIGLGRSGTMDGRVTGIKVALFDVSVPTDPREKYAIDLGGRQSSSVALDDHRAFLQMDLPHLGYDSVLIAFPLTLSSKDEYKRCDEDYLFSGTKVFQLGTDQFVELASISHARANGTFLEETLGSESLCGECPAYKIRRIFFSGEDLFALSDRRLSSTSMKTWSETWADDLHSNQVLMAETDCGKLAENPLLKNLTSQHGYSSHDAIAAIVMQNGRDMSLSECFSKCSDADPSSKGLSAWSSYTYCSTNLGRNSYESLGVYAGDCCSAASSYSSSEEEEEETLSACKKEEANAKTCKRVSYSPCNIWY
ncbi:beta propeller domain-containing protein [Chloropicon primus]|nr:beta propeller domain-containing protein [Chloropicon primus]